MNKYAILGRSLDHSLSPEMHNLAFNLLGLDASYQKIEIDSEKFDIDIRRLKDQNYSGFNITIPYKSIILPFLDEIDDEAKRIGAVNTIKVSDDKWIGFNTDVGGFIQPLLSLGKSFDNCIILGNGGAARAVVFAILTYLEPTEIYMCARDINKTLDIINQYHNPNIKHYPIEKAHELLSVADLVINTTPLGTNPEIDATPIEKIDHIKPNIVVYDLVYNPPKTRLISDAKQLGKDIITISGLDMLVEQAARSFHVWTGQKFPSAQVRERLEEVLKVHRNKST